MKKLPICVQTSTWYGQLFGGEQGADEAFAYIKSLGFEGLDYNLDNCLTPDMISQGQKNDFFDASVEEILDFYKGVKEASQKHGVEIQMAHGIFPMHSDVDPSMDDYLIMATEKLLAVCQYLGCPALVVHPVTRANRTLEKEMNLAMYRKLMPAARKYGVKICLENMFAFIGGHAQRRACANIEEACWYIDTLNAEAGEELFGFCYDVGHANVMGNNIYEDLKLLGKRLTLLHIHENDGRLDMHLIPFTHTNVNRVSTTDWDGFLRGLKEIGYTGPLNFEIFAAIVKMPRPLIKPLLTLAKEIGVYFRTELTN